MDMNCKFCGNKAPNNLRGYCQACYKYFVMDEKSIHPLPKYGEITYTENGDVICPFCGKAFRKIGMHFYYSHKMTSDEAFKKAGWDRNARATNINYREHMRSVLQDKCVTENLLNAGMKTRFSVGSMGRPKEKISQMTLNRMRGIKNGK